jgi:hypothetical protein
MDKEKDDTAFSVELSPEKAAAHLSENALSKIGHAVEWLFPKHAAKAKITAAIATRVSTKIEKGLPLDTEECTFCRTRLRKGGPRLSEY